MSALIVIKGEDGKLHGMGDKGLRAFGKFQRHVAGMEPGDTMAFSYKLPRSPKHHRLFMAKMNALTDRQEQFEDLDSLRKWVCVGAGYADFVPGPTGRMVALPQSIAFESMDEGDFSELHKKCDDFLRTDHARRFLWPHLSDDKSWHMVNAFINEFDSRVVA